MPRFSTWSETTNKAYALAELLRKCQRGSGIFAYRVNEEIAEEFMGRFYDKIVRAIDGDILTVTEGPDTHYLLRAT